MRDRAIEFKVGLLILIGLVVFGGFIFILGNFSFSSGYTLYVDYGFSGNIQPGAPVKVSGIKVGKVEDVDFLGGKVVDKGGRRVQVRLEVWVEDRVADTIRRDAEFFINTSGVLGEQYLEIVPGDDYQNPPLGEDVVVAGVDPPRTDLIVARLYVVLDQLSKVLTEDRDFISNLLKNGASAVGEVDKLLRENNEEMGALIQSASKLSESAAVTLDKVNQGLEPPVVARTVKHADQLLVTANDTLAQLSPQMRAFLADALRVTGILTKERIDRLLKVADGAVSTTGKAGKLIDNVDGMVTDLRRGKGTAGALLVREEVYADLREMIRDLKRNPWKFFWKE
ncbi:MAG TPA: MlaD family protein [Kofleriaceae bacterium]|jgi:phospholipid/cholesterol/gamma-HCH transport system substrate-binding protein